MKETGPKKIYIILLFLLIIFHCVNNYFWLNKDCIPGGVDTIHNLNDQMKFYNKLTLISDLGKGLGMRNLLSLYLSLFSVADPRNNTMHFIPSIANIIFGPSLFVTRMANLIYYIILIIAVYFIGKKISDKKTGLLAAFLISFYPAICGVSRQYEHDFPGIALVALCICTLIYTEGFKSKKYSLFFGLSLGLAILFRGQALFFIIGPLVYILHRAFLKNKQYEFGRIFNFAFSASLALLISSIWWGGHLKELLTNLCDHVKVFYVPYTPSLRYVHNPIIQEWGRIPYKFPTVNWFLFYLFNTIAHTSLSFFLIFIIGLFTFVKSNKIKEKAVLLLWIVVPYIIFTVISFKFGHYYFPSFPAIALISAAGIFGLKWRIIKIPLVILILSLGLIQFFLFSFISGRLPYLSLKLPTVRMRWCTPPKVNNLNQVVANFAEMIKENAPQEDIKVGIISEWPPHLEYILRLHIPCVRIYHSLYGDIIPPHINFLIISSKPDSHMPNYELLRYKYERWAAGETKGLSGKELLKKEEMVKDQIAFINETIEEFKSYKILEKTLLLPEKHYIFLTTKSS